MKGRREFHIPPALKVDYRTQPHYCPVCAIIALKTFLDSNKVKCYSIKLIIRFLTADQCFAHGLRVEAGAGSQFLLVISRNETHQTSFADRVIKCSYNSVFQLVLCVRRLN